MIGNTREQRVQDRSPGAPRGAEDRAMFDLRALRHALGRFATGITVVTTTTPSGKREGLTVNSFGALSLDPPLVLWSLNHTAMSLPSFQESPYFAVNILASHQRKVSNHFARPAPDKFEAIEWQAGLGGCPTIPGCLALFECRLQETIAGGDHVVLIGRVERFCWSDGDPLVFSCGRYCIAATLPDEARADVSPSDFADLLL